MFKRFCFAALFGLTFVGYASAQTIIIDNFTTGSPPSGSTIGVSQTGLGSNTQTFSGLSASTVINPLSGTDVGRRIVRAHVTLGANSVALDNTGINDQFNVALGAATEGHFHLYYGYVNYNPALTPTTQLAADYADLNRSFLGGGNNALQISVLNPDHNGAIEILLISHRGNIGGTEAFATFSVPYVTGNPSTQPLTFLFSSFPGIDFTDVDQIIVEPQGDLLAAADLGLDNFIVTAVPEPAALALLGGVSSVVVGGLWYRRRKAAKVAQCTIG